MFQHTKLFFCALMISFLGSLPIGTLNVTVTGLVINKGIAGAVEFALGAVLVEVTLVRIAVGAVNRLEGLKKLHKLFSLLTCLLLFSFAWISLYAAFKLRKFEIILPITSQRPFISGLVLSIINPLHLPFWMGWTAFLKSKKIFSDSIATYNIYVVGIALGTSIAFIVYGIFGSFLVEYLKEKQLVLNWIIGISFLMTALAMLYKRFTRSPSGNEIDIRAKSELANY